VLIVAGSDSGGGAGIQGDIKTVTVLGGYAMTAVTAVTVQNTCGVSAVHDIPPDIVAAQITSVLEDIGADVIKTGMLSSAPIIEAAAQAIASTAAAVPRVIDPVMRAKGGHALLADDARVALVNLMIRGAVLVTPNLPEAEVLTGRTIACEADMLAAVDALRELGANAVLLKGGHLPGDRLLDLLILRDRLVRFEGSRIHSNSTHGTGCALASAIATHLALGRGLEEAVARARDFVRQAITEAPGLGHGQGPLNHAFGRIDGPRSGP
jgi:hydroxymethylpyrimidine/phosphomethylpyrimidine kinase